jgi:hypothetical protein
LTCESCRSIDVREWARRAYLRPGLRFSWSWSRDGEPWGSITVRTGPDINGRTGADAVPGAVVLSFRSREQRVPISWTECNFGSWRPWFCCSCGRDAAKLYDGGGDFFACRHCCGLAYASQQMSPRDRNISRARRIRMRLGGGPSIVDPFPDKPRGMHWRTYERLRARAQVSEARSYSFLMGSLRRRRLQRSR